MSNNRKRKNKNNRPQDHRPAKQELVRLDTPAGVVRIKKFNVKVGFLRKNRHDDEAELMFKLLERHADEANLEIIDELTFPQLKAVFVQWQEESGADLGES